MRKKASEQSAIFSESHADKKVCVTGHEVNIRSAPGLEFRIFGTVAAGDTLLYYDTVSDKGGDYWYEVNYNGKHGFICGKYSKIVSEDNEVR